MCKQHVGCANIYVRLIVHHYISHTVAQLFLALYNATWILSNFSWLYFNDKSLLYGLLITRRFNSQFYRVLGWFTLSIRIIFLNICSEHWVLVYILSHSPSVVTVANSITIVLKVPVSSLLSETSEMMTHLEVKLLTRSSRVRLTASYSPMRWKTWPFVMAMLNSPLEHPLWEDIDILKASDDLCLCEGSLSN